MITGVTDKILVSLRKEKNIVDFAVLKIGDPGKLSRLVWYETPIKGFKLQKFCIKEKNHEFRYFIAGLWNVWLMLLHVFKVELK